MTLAMLLAFAASACGSAASIAIRSYGGGQPDARDVDGIAAGLTSTGTLLVTTFTSSTCPLLPTKLDTVNAHEVAVTLSRDAGPDPVGSGCTTDAAANTSEIALDKRVDVQSPLTVNVKIGGTTTTVVAEPA